LPINCLSPEQFASGHFFCAGGKLAGMKSIAASIVVLAGAITFSAGALLNHADTQLFVMIVGGALGLIGFGLLGMAWKQKDN
jgi:hypothetical protein